MFLKPLLLFSLLIIVTMAEQLSVEEQWTNFKAKHEKSYDGEEEEKRFAIFQENVRKIDEHNKKYETGEVTFKQGINQFSDLTPEEFQKYKGFRRPKSGDSNAPTAI